jgi:hypothetical protein
MSHTRPRAIAKPSNRLTHGLTSRNRSEGWRTAVEVLALDLIANAPRTAEILRTAHMLAQEIITVEATRSEKRKVFQARTPPRKATGPWGEDVVQAANPHGQVAGPDTRGGGDVSVLLLLKAHALRSLDELERKAVSRRSRLLKRLDHLIIEERRKHPAKCEVFQDPNPA